MRRPIRWLVRATALLTCSLLWTVGLVAPPAHGVPAKPGWTDTPFGPLGPADRDVLERVRLAGLWEAPAGRLAQDRSDRQEVKRVGATLESDHIELDAVVVATAAKLGVKVPEVPNPEQELWLRELSSRSGEAFDRTFADRLRSAHGNVFSAIAFVRAGSRNEVMREFAEVGVNIVMKHMTLLEGTGLVNYSLLTPPPAPPLPRAEFSERSTGIVWFVWLVLAVAVVAGAMALVRAFRPR